jgi:ADP-ribose pyrophosphatase YjhB (NUDIX family)
LQHQLTSEIRSTASKQNSADYQALFAGQGVRLAQNISVASLIKQFENEALTLLSKSEIKAVNTTEVSAQKAPEITAQWLKWVIALQSIAQNGLTFTRDPYDKERFTALREISAEIAAHYSDISYEHILNLFTAETGYATPKLDVRAAVFQNNKILLVRERSDNLWTLPGGWADVNESASVGAMRETQEESGYDVKVIKLIALFDKHKHDHPPQLPHTYKCFFLCELVGGAPQTSHEIAEVKFFALDNLPELSLHRVTEKQILRCYDHYLNPELPTDFD